MDNILLVDTITIRSIPKYAVGEIASRDVITFTEDYSIKQAVKELYNNKIDGAPVIKNGNVVGVFTLNELVNAIANYDENKNVGDVMSKKVVCVNEDLKIVNAIEVMLKNSSSRLIIVDSNHNLTGIVTRTDLIESITNFKQFPVIY